MKKFMDGIVHDSKRKDSCLNDLFHSNLPTYMYGAGNLARMFTSALEKLGGGTSHIDGYFVDPGCLVGEYFCDKPVFYLGDTRLLSECNVITGFNIHPDIVQERLSSAYECIDHIHLFSLDMSMFPEENVVDHITYDYVKEHEREFEKIYSLCADDLSRDVLIRYLNAKISGNPKWLVPIVSESQYFPKDLFSLGLNEVFVDCGAYNGDTILSFLKECDGKYNHIFAFEPDPENMGALQRTISDRDIAGTTCYQLGVWNKHGTCGFVSVGEQESSIDNASSSSPMIEVDSLDNVIGPTNTAVSFIKMDVEGAEYNALAGAANVIQTYHPKLAICAYHRKDDIFRLPELILSLSPDYKIYFRHHSFTTFELVCYAL